MALTEDHKAKMKAGRVRAAAERKDAAKSTVGMPAGDERNEQRRVNADALEEQAERHDEQHGLGAIDPAKLAKRDSETLFRIEDSKGGVQNPQPGYRYVRITLADAYRESGSKANIRAMHAQAKENGFEPVHGPMVEDDKYKGNDHATGSSLRGLADTVLYRITDENWERLQVKNAEKARRQGGVEDQVVRYAESRGIRTMHGAAGDFRSQDSLMAQVAGDAGRVETFRGQRPGQVQTTMTEGDIRRGSIKGPNGQTMKPGFEREAPLGR
jgi:hypothetical protein